MCSWCWGFAPEIEDLAIDWPVDVVVGGLRPGPAAQVLEASLAGYLKKHWVEIGERTGQPFDLSILDERIGWLYDSEPSAIAIGEVRKRNLKTTLDYFSDIQQAFFADGLDIADFDVLTELAAGHVNDLDDFREALDTDEAKRTAWADFTQSRNWGISGFPTLVGELTDDRLALLARGYTPAKEIKRRIGSLSDQAAG